MIPERVIFVWALMYKKYVKVNNIDEKKII